VTENFKVTRQSLIYRGDGAIGWNQGWKINLWARILGGDQSYELLQKMLRPSKGGAGSYANLFDAHPGLQEDGNFRGRGRCWGAGGAEASWLDRFIACVAFGADEGRPEFLCQGWKN
jgi:hypothetical protein